MENHELKALINKPRFTGPLQVGESVRVRPRADVRDPQQSPTYTGEMNEKHAGETHIIRRIEADSIVVLEGIWYSWRPDWLERV